METGRTQASDKNWRAWLVRIGRLQRQVKRDIEQQLWEPHLWCKYGKTYRIPKKGTKIEDQETPNQYVPKLSWKAEGRWYIQEKITMLVSVLSAQPNDPITPELKSAIEHDIAETLGYGDVKLKTGEELRKMKEEELKTLAKIAKPKEPKITEVEKPPKTLEETESKLRVLEETIDKLSFKLDNILSKPMVVPSYEPLPPTVIRLEGPEVKAPKEPIEIKIKHEEAPPQKIEVTTKTEPIKIEVKEKKVEVDDETKKKKKEILEKIDKEVEEISKKEKKKGATTRNKTV